MKANVSTKSKLAYNDFLSSRIVSLESSDGRRFYAHQKLLTHKSNFFQHAFEGHDDLIPLMDEDASIVAALVEYLYTNNYPSPVPEVRKSLEDNDTPSISPAHAEEDRRAIRTIAEDDGFSEADRNAMVYEAKKEHTLYLSYGNVLKFHASMYAVGQRLEIPGLSELSVQLLRKVLIWHIDVVGTHVRELVDLINFVYDEDKIRLLVAKYIAINFNVIKGAEEVDLIHELVTNGGPFGWDLLCSLNVLKTSGEDKVADLNEAFAELFLKKDETEELEQEEQEEQEVQEDPESAPVFREISYS